MAEEIKPELVQVTRDQLNELIAANEKLAEQNKILHNVIGGYEEDIQELADSLGMLETKYQLFSILSKLGDSNFLKIGNAILTVLRKISADKQRDKVFTKIKDIAVKYANRAQKQHEHYGNN